MYIEALAQRAGTYIPRTAGMGLSYLSGSFSVDGRRLAVPQPQETPRPEDVFIRSIPDFEYVPQTGHYVPFAQDPVEQPYPPGADYANSAAVAYVGGNVGNGHRTADDDEEEHVDDHIDDHGEHGHDDDHGDHQTESGNADAVGASSVNNANTVDTNSNAADREIGEYSPEEQRVIDELQRRDREVRAHEQAHVVAGGAYVRGGASYEYEQGPDNRRYAVGGEVSIDTSPVRDDPEATVAKMQVVRAAALAPADPSAQDRAVAAAASRAEAAASAELRVAEAEETQGEGGDNQSSINGQNVADGQNADGQNAAGMSAEQTRMYNDAIAAYTVPFTPQTQMSTFSMVG